MAIPMKSFLHGISACTLNPRFRLALHSSYSPSFSLYSSSSSNTNTNTNACSSTASEWQGLATWRTSPVNENRRWGLCGPDAADKSTTIPEEISGNVYSLAEWGALVLSTADPARKACLSHHAYKQWCQQKLPLGVVKAPDGPARPNKPILGLMVAMEAFSLSIKEVTMFVVTLYECGSRVSGGLDLAELNGESVMVLVLGGWRLWQIAWLLPSVVVARVSSGALIFGAHGWGAPCLHLTVVFPLWLRVVLCRQWWAYSKVVNGCSFFRFRHLVCSCGGCLDGLRQSRGLIGYDGCFVVMCKPCRVGTTLARLISPSGCLLASGQRFGDIQLNDFEPAVLWLTPQLPARCLARDFSLVDLRVFLCGLCMFYPDSLRGVRSFFLVSFDSLCGVRVVNAKRSTSPLGRYYGGLRSQCRDGILDSRRGYAFLLLGLLL
eukprot:Gb_22758 [translate_table: standard]